MKLLRRMSRYAYGLGDAKNLTSTEYEVRSKQLLSLPARLTGAIAKHLADVTIHVSLTHEGDTAAAVAILETE